MFLGCMCYSLDDFFLIWGFKNREVGFIGAGSSDFHGVAGDLGARGFPNKP